MLEINNIFFSYPDGKVIFDGLSFAVKNGERVCLKAPSGKGKTTLLRLLCGLEKPQKGKIITENGAKIAFSPQQSDLFDWYSAVKNVALVSDEKNAKKWLDLFDLGDCFDKLPSKLSGGMQKRVSLARAVSYEPDILLLDETFSGIDSETKLQIMDILKRHFAEKIIIFASHSESEIEQFATRIIEL